MSYERTVTFLFAGDYFGNGTKIDIESKTDTNQIKTLRVPTLLYSSQQGISIRICSSDIKRVQERSTEEAPERIKEINQRVVMAEITPPSCCPIAENAALPPSSRKTGSRFNADDINPDLPTMKNGCIGIGCANGSIIVLGKRHDKMDPRRKLDFIFATEMTGNLAISASHALLVNAMPLNTKPSDTARAVIGPLSAKSRRNALLGGKDFIGVMHPKNGKESMWSEGIGTGSPIFIFRLLATK